MVKTTIELFAGVGGFRVGLNNVQLINNETIENDVFNFVWANQWEPSTKIQHAFDCYQTRFGINPNHSNQDIAQVNKRQIPEHNLLCGGFPCQDYSVARSLSNERGIEGKKGVLWWQIKEILEIHNTPFVLLENVDRLLKSPSKQRGRDFGIILRCLAELGYIVEWRVINAADYGLPQRRRRTYIFAYKQNTLFGENIANIGYENALTNNGVFAQAFPIQDLQRQTQINIFDYNELVDVSNNFAFCFENTGIMIDGVIHTAKSTPVLVNPTTLGDILDINAGNNYDLSQAQINKFAELRGAKKILRYKPNGEPYYYSEGSMAPVDYLNLPGRTMLTSEASVNRSSHIIDDPNTNTRRFLTPIECERLNQFPDNWTNTGMPEKRRYFMMGNALVCGIVSKLSPIIQNIMDNEPDREPYL